MTQATNQATNPAASFDLIMEGVGYLNRVREVSVRKGPAYLACTINALMGTADSVEYVSIDLKVVGKQAMQVVEQLAKDVEARRKVLVGFRAGDPKPDFYEFEDKTTKQMVQREGLKARLLQITFAKVDGQKVDIPLVERPAKPSDAVQSGSDVGPDGAGSACGDASRVPAEV
jgi:hypothetical protein